jgi:hypothetical protein
MFIYKTALRRYFTADRRKTVERWFDLRYRQAGRVLMYQTLKPSFVIYTPSFGRERQSLQGLGVSLRADQQRNTIRSGPGYHGFASPEVMVARCAPRRVPWDSSRTAAVAHIS